MRGPCARRPGALLPSTPRQREVLALMLRHKAEHDEWPPIRWLMEQLGIVSTNAMTDHLRALVRKGLAEQRLGKGRAYHVTAKGRRELGLPTQHQHAAQGEGS